MTKESSESDSMIVMTTVVMGICTIVAAIIPVYLEKENNTKAVAYKKTPRAVVATAPKTVSAPTESSTIEDKAASPITDVANLTSPEVNPTPQLQPIATEKIKEDKIEPSEPKTTIVTIEPKILFSDTKEPVVRPRVSLTEEGKSPVLVSSSRPYTQITPGVYQLEIQHRSCQTKKLANFLIPASSEHFVLEVLLDPK